MSNKKSLLDISKKKLLSDHKIDFNNVPVLLEPGEVIFSPEQTKIHEAELVNANKQVPRFGTVVSNPKIPKDIKGEKVPGGGFGDKVPMLLERESFVLNRRASELIEQKNLISLRGSKFSQCITKSQVADLEKQLHQMLKLRDGGKIPRNESAKEKSNIEGKSFDLWKEHQKRMEEDKQYASFYKKLATGEIEEAEIPSYPLHSSLKKLAKKIINHGKRFPSRKKAIDAMKGNLKKDYSSNRSLKGKARKKQRKKDYDKGKETAVLEHAKHEDKKQRKPQKRKYKQPHVQHKNKSGGTTHYRYPKRFRRKTTPDLPKSKGD